MVRTLDFVSVCSVYSLMSYQWVEKVVLDYMKNYNPLLKRPRICLLVFNKNLILIAIRMVA